MQTIEAAEMAETGNADGAPIEPQPHPMQYIAIDPLDRAWFAGSALGRAGIDAEPRCVMSPERDPPLVVGIPHGRSDRIGGRADRPCPRRAGRRLTPPRSIGRRRPTDDFEPETPAMSPATIAPTNRLLPRLFSSDNPESTPMLPLSGPTIPFR